MGNRHYDETNRDSSARTSLTISLIRCILTIYTIITLPIYYFFQRPWGVQSKREKMRSYPSTSGEGFVVYQSLAEMTEMSTRLIRNKVDTIEKVLRYSVEQHGQKKALGTRQILAEEDEKQPDGRVMKKLILGDYQWRTFNEMDIEAERFGRGLRELGLEAKDNVVIYAETRAEWLISASGCMKQNMALVTLYATLDEDALVHGINETEVTCVITSQELLPKLKKLLPSTPNVSTLIVFEDKLNPLDLKAIGEDDVKILPYNRVIRLGEMSSITDAEQPSSEDTAIIMYTSGSTGLPKGVVLSHRNFMSSMMSYTRVQTIYDSDIYMAYLPLAHVLEFIGESMCLLYGIPIGYSSPFTMTDRSTKIKPGHQGDASILRPTIMASVPLVLDRIYKGLQEKIETGPPLKKAIFNLALQYKLYWSHRGFDTPLIDALVFKPVRAALGGRIRFLLCGGAPLAPDTHRNLRAVLCCQIHHGFGLTESGCATTMMDSSDFSTETSGGLLPGCSIKLVNWDEGNCRVSDWPYPRGEIHVGGSNVAMGYFKQSGKVNEDFYLDNLGHRWFRTGDIGEFTSQGLLKIIDRKKDLVKLQYGEYVSLSKVEAELKTCHLVDNICVYADPTKMFPVALVMANPDHLEALAMKHGIEGSDFKELCSNPKMEQLILTEIQKHAVKSGRLCKMEIPQAAKLVSEVWTPDSGLVTAALKLKRKNIQDRYQQLIDRMYSRENRVTGTSLM